MWPQQVAEKEIAGDIPGIYDAETAEKIRFAEHDWYMKMGLGSAQDTPPWGQAFMEWWHLYRLRTVKSSSSFGSPTICPCL
jgi:hypothetical protein